VRANADVKVRTVVRISALSLLGLFLAIQLIRYGRDHTNPPVTAEQPGTARRLGP
jgi:hypothetical protein